jgi:hypothetical protein
MAGMPHNNLIYGGIRRNHINRVPKTCRMLHVEAVETFPFLRLYPLLEKFLQVKLELALKKHLTSKWIY